MIDPWRWLEFFQDGDDKQLSMSRLLCFLSFWPATWFILHSDDAEVLGWYLGAFVAGYIGGKFGNALNREKDVQ